MSKPSFRRVNAFGWILFCLLISLMIGMLSKVWFFRWFGSSEPSVWRFGVEAVLLMAQVPLGCAAWKNVRRRSNAYRWDRAMVLLWIGISLIHVLESRFTLQEGSTWRPHIPIMLLWTGIFTVLAFGLTSDPDRDSSVLNDPRNSPAREPVKEQ